MKTNNFSEIFERLKPLGIVTQQQLAKALGITQSAIADAKRRGSFPKGWAVDISQAYNISLKDLLKVGKELSKGEDKVILNAEEEIEDDMYRTKFEKAQEKIISLMEEVVFLKDELQKKDVVSKKREANIR
jgi:hypothetical protein